MQADSLVELEGEQLFELHISNDVVHVLRIDKDLAEIVLAKVVEQFRAQFCLEVQKEDVLLGNHERPHIGRAQLP
jgi:hypothetical protein